ncbi:down syndrome cell adhesion molecule-like protein Dscam2 [Caerostris extrusa]|uniref:Down syndrome cell adhesion molecule-like protein Dscam2 n=1 Tax=Caerostris extrusa TaxID=172846 RepID=A0AAV4Y714_CAEEX|nr:down syndrome cell adhesion molecule-like protein Dscam2 [Caerostris extrusa]
MHLIFQNVLISIEITSNQVSASPALRCSWQSIPRVTWSLDSRPIPENHRVQYGDFVSVHAEVVSFVNVSSARSEDGGVHECRAQNEAGSVSHKERVDVLGPSLYQGNE